MLSGREKYIKAQLKAKCEVSVLQPRLLCNHLDNPKEQHSTDPRSLGLTLPPQRDMLLSLTFETKSGPSPFPYPQTFWYM